MSINTIALEAASKAGNIPAPPSKDDGLAALTKYIPTESISLYIAAISAQAALSSIMPWLTPSVSYFFFVALTPILMLVLSLRHLALAGLEWRLPLRDWPWWQIVASTIAFAVWALAVPGNPIVDTGSPVGGVVAAFAAVFISTILNVAAPFFEQRRS